MGELLRWMVVLLSITSIALASLHGEEEEQDILAVIDISLSLSFSSCDDINCDNGGSCFKGNCVCPDKTTGMYCEVLENPCEPNPCYANGNCSETEEGYICECPRDFFGTNCDVIQSPNYPDNYANNTVMTWVLSGIPDKYILLQFEDVFEIEDTSVSNSCGNVSYNSVSNNGCYDYIKIITGDINVKYCGGAPPSPITAQEGSDVLIVFRADSFCSYRGFKLNYTHIDQPIPPVNPIISPSYPNMYPDDTYLTWLVLGRRGFNISFTFNGVFGLEIGEYGCYDYVMVYTNDKYCGNVKPQPIVVPTGEDAMVIFNTDDSEGSQGFNLTYEYQEN
ncbi:hypothetical protein SNE40_017530 [Patella caerulea]|uniref:Uncharacterized protein n=1 Tax=Patella caerulea TaxID=87958 RepID=A0AAN8JAL3_PATCE